MQFARCHSGCFTGVVLQRRGTAPLGAAQIAAERNAFLLGCVCASCGGEPAALCSLGV